MLLQALITISCLMTLVAIAVSQSLYMASIERSHIVAGTIAGITQSAIEDARILIAARIATPPNIGIPSPQPSPIETSLPICGVTASGCTIGVHEEFSPAIDQLAPTQIESTPAPCPTDATSAGEVCNLQSGGNLREGRASIIVKISLFDGGGSPLANVTRLIRFRTFAAKPYAVVIGVSDPAATDSRTQVADLGGVTPTMAPTATPPPITQNTCHLSDPTNPYLWGACPVATNVDPAFTPAVDNATPGVARDTLIRTYAPCRDATNTSHTHAHYTNWSSGYSFETAPCTANAGDISEFTDDSRNLSTPAAGWSM